ncbi:MAG: phosphoribosylaminoimidazolesuccinocarboxamide synthase [Betaproteobacteria bacterium]|jgi:phosphoribosylaminoimidazole-succinocarboxamide synthase|nr:phosphoribosylaminoimidazolesuccinocarboxamide synthase [Betaproteobacteria bacterium]OZB45105.1 MAG: phosphoribosylaminoimidazolesuccinocarboxamide synthase [Thiomonas sp. 15-66-11]OZB64275.1 MAG: phosphoribosylaminoimidazolesuccinocarboxamide synthase [Thiomonas sp. 13-66-29]
MTPTLLSTNITSLPLLSRGKVRDNYAVGDDLLLMVATDRISAFDVVMDQGIPGKGEMLTRISCFWFGLLEDVVPNHLTGIDPASVVAPGEREQVRGRALVVKRLKPLPVEAVVRGYLAGSGWKDYQAGGKVCGVSLPAGLQQAARLPHPIFTPATKAELGEHDENIDFGQMVRLVGVELAAQVHDVSLEIYNRAAAHAQARGIILADTKFEFGLDAQGRLVWMDEALTPDSSRFWPADQWREGISPPSFDKQFLRDWLETVPGWTKQPPPPPLPAEVLEGTAAKYREALDRLTARI